MIRAVIDTNNLPRDVSSPSAAVKRLITLIQEEVVSVLMPHVIAEEWRTQQLDHLRRQLQKAADVLDDTLNGGHLQDHPELLALRAGVASVKRTMEGVDAISGRALLRLLHVLQTEVIPISNEHGARVAAAYFKGSSPFAGVKSRKDFPDAFVYEAVVDLTGPDQDDHVVVVTGDGNLGKHLSLLPGVACFETLEKFVESDQVRELTSAIELEAKWGEELPTLVAAVKEHESDMLSQEFVNSFINMLVHHEVEHDSIPSDNRDATVSMVGDPEDVEIDWDEAEDYGPGILRVPFSCTSEVLLDFYVYHAAAYSLPEKISISWGDYDETPSFEAQANATAAVKGFMTVTFRNWPDRTELESIVATVDEITGVVLEEDRTGNIWR